MPFRTERGNSELEPRVSCIIIAHALTGNSVLHEAKVICSCYGQIVSEPFIHAQWHVLIID